MSPCVKCDTRIQNHGRRMDSMPVAVTFPDDIPFLPEAIHDLGAA